MDIIAGTAVPVNLMTLQPENGRTLYALSGVEWGALNDATENRDRYVILIMWGLFILTTP